MTLHTDTENTAPDFTEIYAGFSSSLDPAELPKSVIAAAQINIYDTLACSIAGVRAPGVHEVLDIVRDWGGKAEAEVLWTSLSVPAPNAAWINGIMAHACDYDDTHGKAILHARCPKAGDGAGQCVVDVDPGGVDHRLRQFGEAQ